MKIRFRFFVVRPVCRHHQGMLVSHQPGKRNEVSITGMSYFHDGFPFTKQDVFSIISAKSMGGTGWNA
jgi:hypothetical protein